MTSIEEDFRIKIRKDLNDYATKITDLVAETEQLILVYSDSVEPTSFEQLKMDLEDIKKLIVFTQKKIDVIKNAPILQLVQKK